MSYLSTSLILAIFASFSMAQDGAWFFSVDRAADTLVRVEYPSGAVEIVGPLGIDTSGSVMLDWLGDRLFMVADVGENIESLVELNPTTGGAISVTQIQLGTTNAEGFAVVRSGPLAGQLWLGHGTSPVSGTLSVLHLDGALTGSRTVDVDTDVMLWSEEDGQMLCHDGRPSFPSASQRTNIVGVISFETGFVQSGSTTTGIDNALGDYAIAPDGAIWCLNNRLPELARVDPMTGSRLEVIQYVPSDLLRGLAAVRACSPADTAPPFGVLDFNDVIAYLAAFGALDPAADIADPVGVLDFNDVVAYLTLFAAGCP